MTSAPANQVQGLAQVVLFNGRFNTLDPAMPEASAVAIDQGVFVAVDDDAQVMTWRGPETLAIDCLGQRVIPGLCDNHTHLIRGGLSFNLELRRDGLRSLADAMAMLAEQVARTPPPHWVRVVGGFSEHQFSERRLPTLEEINKIAPETPVFILHLYDRAPLNRAALRAAGYTRDTPDPPGGAIVRDTSGEPTGLLIASPNAGLLYRALGRAPRLDFDHQLNSTRQFMRELNRLGVTSVIDAGGGGQAYPEDYAVVRALEAAGQMTVRIAYNLFTQRPGEEHEDFARWSREHHPGEGSDYLRLNGAGEMLVFSAADFEDFRQPRPELAKSMEEDLASVVRILAANRWPWRMHATYEETITRALDVFEAVDRDIPLKGLNWFFDHAETVSQRSLDRIAALGGGVAFQHRMAFQGEDFVARYGPAAAAQSPPTRKVLASGVRVSAGTDATRVASYDPLISIAWLVTGRTLGGLELYAEGNRLDREAALRAWTQGGAWFSGQEGRKGQIKVGQMADLAILDRDYFAVDEAAIGQIRSDLTMVAGRVVHGAGAFLDLSPVLPPAAPDWSPAARFEGGIRTFASRRPTGFCACQISCAVHGHDHGQAALAADWSPNPKDFWGALGCACWMV